MSFVARGTTPTHTFNIPVDASLVEEVRIVYAQGDKEVFRKETFDCDIEGKQIKVTLTQDETLLLNHRIPVQIQCQFKTADGTAFASIPNVIAVQKCLCNEVL